MNSYDALLVLSFGGPEGPEDVLPFLENVLRGKNVPEARKLEVAKHYQSFGGVSPINAQNRLLIQELEKALPENGIHLPVYWGNRNWKPFLKDALRQMHDLGHRKILTYITSAYSSYSGCRQYLDDIESAKSESNTTDLRVEKIREFHNHPLFIEVWKENILRAFRSSTPSARLIFTAHSIPLAMSSNSKYLPQLKDTASLIAKEVGHDHWDLVFQSRSGPPQQPWLEPDILQHLEILKEGGTQNVIIAPIGFISDHLEVVYDLDHQAKEKADELGIQMTRAKTPGTDSKFVELIIELIQERMEDRATRRSMGEMGTGSDQCKPDCCAYTPRQMKS